jgi:hypothetical protein
MDFRRFVVPLAGEAEVNWSKISMTLSGMSEQTVQDG